MNDDSYLALMDKLSVAKAFAETMRQYANEALKHSTTCEENYRNANRVVERIEAELKWMRKLQELTR